MTVFNLAITGCIKLGEKDVAAPTNKGAVSTVTGLWDFYVWNGLHAGPVDKLVQSVVKSQSSRANPFQAQIDILVHVIQSDHQKL